MAKSHDEQLEVAYAVGDVVSGTVTDIDDDGWLWLDVEGWDAGVSPQDLALADGESARGRYAVSQTIEGLFVFDVDHEYRYLSLSVKRNAPGYPEALQRRAVGEVVSGTVTTEVYDDAELWLDVDGLVGSIAPDELALGDGESARDRYTVGQTIEGLFVWWVDHETRDLGLSVRRNVPGYVEALRQRVVGEVVSGTVTTEFYVDGWLCLDVDVDGLVGEVKPQDALASGEFAQEGHIEGLTIEGLFVWDVDHEYRYLSLSVKRNAPGYLEALQRRAVGDVVSATVVAFWDDGLGIWLDVDGLVGSAGPQELDLDDGESAQERYAVGQTINDLFVWDVDHEYRYLSLSVKRNASGYLEALQRRAVGDVVSATVAAFWDDGLGIWLDVDGQVGSVRSDELGLADGESMRERYAVGETIDDLFVWRVDHEHRDLYLSVKRNAVGNVVFGTVTNVDDDGWLWLDVEGWDASVPPWELALADGESAQDRYAVGETIEGLFILQIDHEARALDLSVKRNAPSYVKAFQRCAVGDVVAGTVTDVDDGGRLSLDVDGLVGLVSSYELILVAGESTRGRYSVGETIEDLFVWQVLHEARELSLSIKRSAPGYVEALQQCAVGDIASGTITYVGDGLLLDVDGLVGVVPPYEIVLTEEESTRERYTVGETIDGLFVWQVEHDSRRIALSANAIRPPTWRRSTRTAWAKSSPRPSRMSVPEASGWTCRAQLGGSSKRKRCWKTVRRWPDTARLATRSRPLFGTLIARVVRYSCLLDGSDWRSSRNRSSTVRRSKRWSCGSAPAASMCRSTVRARFTYRTTLFRSVPAAARTWRWDRKLMWS